MKEKVEIELDEEDLAFCQSEIERLKREEDVDVTVGDVVQGLVDTGISRELHLRAVEAAKLS